MSDRLPHVRAPDGDPDVCVHCREEWVDLLTLYETDECSVRLRAEVERLRAWAEEAAKAENANADDARRERAAVVAWLRSRGMAVHAQSNLDFAATMIERGEHRREETK